MNNRFVQALADEEFQVYLQPKVSLQQRKIKGAEALVRWDYPGRGILQPSEFIPLLENSGKIQALEKYIFERVCRWLKQRKEKKKIISSFRKPFQKSFCKRRFYGRFYPYCR